MTLETTGQQTLQLAHPSPMTRADEVTQAVHAWVSGLDVAMRGAEYIVDTPACPDSFWPLPAGVKLWNIPDRNPKLRLPDESEESFAIRRRIAAQTAGFVVRYGLGIGLTPEVALNGIFVIGGRPSMYAEQMVALVKSHGHQHRVVEQTALRCTVEVRHRNEEEWESFAFTMDDAIRAGYVPGKGPNAGNDQWGKPKKGGNAKYDTDAPAMLYARASSIACRRKFPDVLRGMAAMEDIQDERSRVVVDVDDDERAATAPTTAAAIRDRVAQIEAASGSAAATAEAVTQLADAVDAATADAAPAGTSDSPPPPPSPEPLDVRVWNQINRRFVDLDVTGDGQKASRLAVISHILGHPVTRGGEMTAEEGQTVLDNLSPQVVSEALGRSLARPAEPDPAADGHPDAGDETGDYAPDEAEPSEQEYEAMTGSEAEAEADYG
jgi:hypothetical protein